MRKVIVTGGADFIGSALIRHLVKNELAEVVNLDKLTYAGNLVSLREVSSSPLSAPLLPKTVVSGWLNLLEKP